MLKLQRVNHVVQREVELALLLERLDDRQVVHAAVLDADDLIADAVAQQVDGEVAGLEGEPAVVGGRRAAALGVAEHGRARLALALVFEQQGELFGADRVVLVDALRAVLDEVAAPVGSHWIAVMKRDIVTAKIATFTLEKPCICPARRTAVIEESA